MGRFWLAGVEGAEADELEPEEEAAPHDNGTMLTNRRAKKLDAT